jgi:hypothetical protein
MPRENIQRLLQEGQERPGAKENLSVCDRRVRNAQGEPWLSQTWAHYRNRTQVVQYMHLVLKTLNKKITYFVLHFLT